MHAELKRNLLVGARAFPDWYGELDGFKIHEESGKLVLDQVSQRTLLVEVRFSRERDGLHAPLLFVEQRIRHIAQFAHSMGLDMCFQSLALCPGQPMQRLLCLRLLALAIREETAFIGRAALLAR